MNFVISLTTFSFIISLSLAIDSSFRCGDDWIAFNDEKCYKVINKSLTRDEAISACSDIRRTSYLPSIVTIKSLSEQKFLENHLFNELGNNENVWIGAKRSDNNDESLHFNWDDGTRVVYKNWAENSPSNDPDSTCVQMEENGKWVDKPCSNTGTVICEKLQIWTFPELLNTFFEWRRHLENKNQELEETIDSKDVKIKSLEKSLNQLNEKLSSLTSEMNKISIDFNKRLNNTFDILREQNKESENKISKLEKKANKLVDGMLALHEECSNGCSNGNDDGPTDGQLEAIRHEIIKEVEAKLEPIEYKLGNTVIDARLAIISYRRTLQIKKMEKDEWISLGYV